MFGKDELARGRREAHENIEARNRLAKAEAEDASRARRAHESPSAGRRDFVGFLNSLSADDAGRQQPGLDAIETVRKLQQINARSASAHNRHQDQLIQKGASPEIPESFNRLGSGTVNTAAPERTKPPAKSSFGWRSSEPQLPFGDRGGPGKRPSRTYFDFQDGGAEPGNYGSRYSNFEDGDPVLRPGERVSDAAGSLTGGEGDHWSTGRVSPIEAAFLLDVTRLLLAAIKQRSYAENKV